MASGSAYNVNYGRRSDSGSRDQNYRDDLYGNINSIGSSYSYPDAASVFGDGSSPLGMVLSGGKYMLNTLLNTEKYYDELRQSEKNINSQAGLYRYGLEYNRIMQEEANALSYLQSKEANQTDMAMLEKANQFNIEQWDRNNEYNSPAAVLQRASDAGINPNFAFGTNVASQPVQQSSVPGANIGSFGAASSPGIPNIGIKRDGSSQSSLVNQLGNMLESLLKMPGYAEDIEAKRLANRRADIENELREFDLREKEEERNMFANSGFIKSVDGSGFISKDQFDSLSDKEKQSYLVPTGYRNIISDKVIEAESYNDLSPEAKKSYVPDYRGSTPELFKFPFRSHDGFETWKSLQALPQVMSNINADDLQNQLRVAVTKGQIKSTQVIDDMINLPSATFRQIVNQAQSIAQKTKHDMIENENLRDRLSDQDSIVRFTARRLENSLNDNVIGIIKKYTSPGLFQDLLIGIASIVDSVNFSSSFGSSYKLGSK